jgi:hypothetical protein
VLSEDRERASKVQGAFPPRDAINVRTARQALTILKSACIDQSPHHIRPNCRQGELRLLLFRKIENALAKLLKYPDTPLLLKKNALAQARRLRTLRISRRRAVFVLVCEAIGTLLRERAGNQTP